MNLTFRNKKYKYEIPQTLSMIEQVTQKTQKEKKKEPLMLWSCPFHASRSSTWLL